MRKISEDIINDAYNEVIGENESIRKSAAPMDKTAFDVSINPSSLVGAITGAFIANKKIKADSLKRQMEGENSSVLQGNYYSQVQNLASNLKIIFTPFGAVFVVKNGIKEITIETIGTDEMSSVMYEAWQHKDAEYFKHLLLNKMYSEIQFVEQQFAKNILEKQLGLQKHITKQASSAQDIDVLTMSIGEIVENIASIKDFYSKQNEATEKLADILLRMVDDGTEYKISWEFTRPLEKYAFLGNSLSFLGLGGSASDIRSLQGSYLSPHYLANRVKVGFLPDRVVFMVDDKVISSLLALDMDSEAFDYFEKQNKKFFRDYFNSESKKGMKRMKGRLPQDKIEKSAQEKMTITSIFSENNIHPVIYLQVLNKELGEEWTTWDVNAMIKVIEDHFRIEDIDDIPLNKIMCIHSLKNNLYPFTSYHVFEKIIRAFSNKPIDFFQRENNDLTIEELAFGFKVIKTIVPNFTESINSEVISYIIETLYSMNCRYFNPDINEHEFFDHINEYLLDTYDSHDVSKIDGEKEQAESVRLNGIMQTTIARILKVIHEHYPANKPFKGGREVRTILEKLPLPDNIRNIVSLQITDGMLANREIATQSAILNEQQRLFGLR